MKAIFDPSGDHAGNFAFRPGGVSRLRALRLLLSAYITRVKGSGAEAQREVFTAVDQSFHLIVLFCTALVVHAAVT